jgi:beta-phosphoglucomutase-like phosphatase (HAD superfamily)
MSIIRKLENVSITTLFLDVGGVLLTNGWDRSMRKRAAGCFVHFRKPDADIYRIALDICQVPPEQVVYVEDRDMFVEVAQSLGLQGIHHVGYEPTRAALAAFGLILI